MKDEILQSWLTTQKNGDIVYTKYAELNLSVDGRPEVEKYKKFCNFTGIILDVGSGLEVPSYMKQNKISLGIGIDPLVKKQSMIYPITLIKSVGETLPFKDNTFDHISFATSFDHVIDPNVVLDETLRLLKDNGIAIFWVEIQERKKLGLIGRVTRKISPAKHDETKQKIIQEQESLILSMEHPEGSADKFHLQHIKHLDFIELACSKGFKKISQEDHPEFDSVFLKFTK